MIPVNTPVIGEKEIEYVMECLQTGWISSEGKFVKEFEEKFSEYCSMRYGIAVNSGTAALETAVWSLGLEEGSEIILPAFTIISCATAIVRNKCVPVLVDVDPVTWCMDVGQVEARITPKTGAVMPVHMYGHPVDMDPLMELAEHHGLRVIEDAAQVHGSEYKGKKCGGFGDVSCFSFYANKLITTGEGGMVLTNSSSIAEKARAYRNLSHSPERRFLHHELGMNFRLTNVQAALGVAQLERIEDIVDKKRRMGKLYTELLGEVPGLQLPSEASWAKQVYWMYSIVLNEEVSIDAEQFCERLGKLGVGTRPFFLSMHEQPALRSEGLFQGENYPVSERISRRGFYLPSGLTLSESEIKEVCKAVSEIIKESVY